MTVNRILSLAALLVAVTLFLAASSQGQAFQVVGTGSGSLAVQASGVISNSTDSGFTSPAQIQSVKYKGNFNGVDLANVELTTGLPLSGTPEGSARFAPGGSIFIGGSGALDGTPAANFILNGTFQSRQTWLFTGTTHVLYAVIKGRIVGDRVDHLYSLVLVTTTHGFAGNGWVDINTISVVRIAG